MINSIKINPNISRTQRCSNNYTNITNRAESSKIKQKSYVIPCRSYV